MKYKKHIFLIQIFLIICGCIYSPMAYFNQDTVTNIQNLHNEYNTLFNELNKPARTASTKTKLKTKVTRKLNKLLKEVTFFKSKQQDVQNNNLQVSQISNLEDITKNVIKIHKMGPMPKRQVSVLREQVNVVFEAMKQLENNKPREA